MASAAGCDDGAYLTDGTSLWQVRTSHGERVWLECCVEGIVTETSVAELLSLRFRVVRPAPDEAVTVAG